MGLSALGLESQRESQGQSDQILMKELEAAAQLDGNNNSNIEDVEALLNSKVSTETDKVAPTKGEDQEEMVLKVVSALVSNEIIDALSIMQALNHPNAKKEAH